jgi:hypothetical protein
MKTNALLCSALILCAPFAAKAETCATVTTDNTEVVTFTEAYQINKIDQAVGGLSEVQRLAVSDVLDQEADRIDILLKCFSRTPCLPAALEGLAEIQMMTANALKEVLTADQFSKLRPVFDERREEVIRNTTAYINGVFYQAALDAGFNPKI